MNNLRTLTIEDIRALKPCYDPARYLAEDWTGTVIDILDVEKCPANDRIWVVLRLIDRFTVEVFAIDCASYAAAAAAAADAIVTDAAYVAADAVDTAADAVDTAADAVDTAADAKQERQRQIESLIYLLTSEVE